MEEDYAENTPLFSQNRSKQEKEEVFDPPFSWTSMIMKEELKLNFKMAFPVLLTNVMQYMVNVETTAFCGRLSATELEGVGFAISLMSAFGWYVCTGMSTACDTMFAQAFGSEDKKRTGLFLQRGFLLLNLVPLFLWAFHFNVEPILIGFFQDPYISRVTGEFVIAFSPGIFFMINYIMLARYMQDQGCLYPPLLAGLCGNVFNICSQLLFVTYLGYGFKASAVCHAFSFAVMVLFEVLYIIKSKFYIPTWPGLQLEAFYDWSQMFKLGLAGVGHLTFEVLVWEITIFLAGLLDPISLASQSVLIQIVTVLSMMFYGFGLTCNIRVGQCLGANRPNHAKTAYRSGLVNSGICVIILASIIISLQYQIPYIFTDKAEVINLITETFPAVYALVFIDSVSGVCAASLRGCGRQGMGGLIIFVTLYLVAIPMSCVLVFVFHYSIAGFWIGNTTGSLLGLILILSLLECQSWKKQAIAAQHRIMASSRVRNTNDESSMTSTNIHQLQMEDELVIHNLAHIRTPSHPVTCSIEIVPLPLPRNNVHKSIIYKKVLLMISMLLFFLLGLSIHFLLPTELYRPFNSSLQRA